MRSYTILFAVVLAFAGCGGGGGGGAVSSPATNVVSTPAPPTLSQNATVQRALVQQALTQTNSTSTIAQYGSSTSSTLSTARIALADRRLAQTVSLCSNNAITTSTAGPTSNVVNIKIDTYYDSKCTTLWWTGAFVATQVSSSLITLNGSYTYYTQSGSVYEYVNPTTISVGGGGTTNYFSVGASVATSLTAAPYVSLGVGCSETTASASCSIAQAQHFLALSQDQAQSATATATISSAANLTTVAVNGSGASYTGAYNAFTLTPQGTYQWLVSGGSATFNISVGGSVSYAPTGAIAALSLAFSDSVNGASVAETYTASTQLITGTLVQTSSNASIASFSVSATTGTGTVSYGTGNVGTITNWIVQS